MDKISMILSGLFLVAMAIYVMPGIMAMNRGKILRNIALWLAIILGLALAYQAFGPGKASLQPPAEQEEPAKEESGFSGPAAPADDQSYTPPKED